MAKESAMARVFSGLPRRADTSCDVVGTDNAEMNTGIGLSFYTVIQTKYGKNSCASSHPRKTPSYNNA
jgi:hypothetical protein